MASYIERSLGAGERVVARGQFHWLYSLAAWGSLLLPLLLVFIFLVPAFQGEGSDAAKGLAALSGILFVAGLIVFLRMMIRKWTTEIGVTSHRFVEKYGLMTLRTNEIALHNIEGVRVSQGVFGKLFGYGTVRIEGTGVDAVTTPPIADPVGFVRAIQTAREIEKS
jgi:uncharacterized membrane protein YdbT with pleckstrin-like domain